VAAVYQLLRFTTLFLSVSVILSGTAATGAGMMVLALAAPTLVVAVLMLQFALTAEAAILPPLRLAALLQLVGAIVLFVRTVRSTMPVTLFVPGAVAALAATSTAFAQAQRWEYAALRILYRDTVERFGFIDDPRSIAFYSATNRITETNGTRFMVELSKIYGPPPARIAGQFSLEALNLLGLHGWELLAVETIPRDSPFEGHSTVQYLFKRPLP